MKKRKWIAIPEELHALIKKTAEQNNRKIVQELQERFTRGMYKSGDNFHTPIRERYN